MAEELTPPDLKQCQAEKPNGNSFMTLGGRPGMERCKNKPKWIATEKKPGPDGLTGSMSLCAGCRKVMEKQMPNYANFEKIRDKRTQEELATLMATHIVQSWESIPKTVDDFCERFGEQYREVNEEMLRSMHTEMLGGEEMVQVSREFLEGQKVQS